MLETVKHNISQLYADDIAFFIIGLDLPAMLQDLHHDLAVLELNVNEKALIMNPDKTQFLILPRVQIARLLACKVKALTTTSTARYIGSVIDDNPTF